MKKLIKISHFILMIIVIAIFYLIIMVIVMVNSIKIIIDY